MEGLNDLFDAHNGDVYFWKGRAKASVALVLDEAKGPCFGHRKIDPRDAHVGIVKFLAHYQACGSGHFLC